MAYEPFGRNSAIWSSEPSEPWVSPGGQLLNLGLFGGAALGAAAGLQRFAVGREGGTAWDMLQRSVRNIAAATPFGLGHTFRLSEFMSPWMSASAQGLREGKSVFGGHSVYTYSLGREYTSTKETSQMLRSFAGEKAWGEAGLSTASNFELRFERGTKSTGVGSLFAREVSYSPSTKAGQAGAYKGSGDWKLLSNRMHLFDLRGPGDILDIASGKMRPQSTGHAFTSILQSIGLYDELGPGGAERILSKIGAKNEVVDRARFAFSPAPGLYDFKRGGALLGAYPAFGMQRLNRLIDVTLQQIPVLGSGIRSLFGESSALNLTVQPGPAHKMFAKFGLAAAKLGGAHLALRQLDHYREKFGIAGNVVVSGGVSAGAYAFLRRNAKGLSPKTSRNVAIASFFGQVLLPGFDKGVYEGIATTGTKMNILRSYAGNVTGQSYWRRTLEGFMPGISNWETGAFLGIGATIASYSKLQNKIWDRPGSLLSKSLHDRIGPVGKIAPPLRLGQVFAEELYDMAVASGGQLRVQKTTALADGAGTMSRSSPWQLSERKAASFLEGRLPSDMGPIQQRKLLSSLYNSVLTSNNAVDNLSWLQDEIFARQQSAIATRRDLYLNDNPVTRSLIQRVEEINIRHGMAPEGLLARSSRRADIIGAQFYHAFFGAPLTGNDFETAMKSMNAKPVAGRAGMLFLGTLLAHQLVTGGLLGSMEDPDELRRIYSGQDLVKVKSGRWWEGGGRPYKGMDTQYMRPHWYHLFMNKAREKSVWGPGEEDLSPVEKFFYKNFTYEFEQRTYHDRPYPMSSAAFSDIPIIGNILAATVGRMIKPPKLMHVNDYMRVGADGNVEFAFEPEWHGPAMGLGGKPMGIPKSPYAPEVIAAEAQYKFREIEGLTGWAKNMMQKAVTGTESFGTAHPLFATAGSIDSPIEKFWEMNLGGGLFMTEPIRRFLPRPRSEIEEYNPILNRMPSWMPDRFKYGDPYRRTDMGWARLPGYGYEALHPELAGVDPESYPLAYQHKILSDVAPYSEKSSRVRELLYQRRLKGLTSASENSAIDRIDRNLAEVAVKRQFDQVHANAIQLPGAGMTQAAYQGALGAVRDVLAPAEYLVPMGFRPAQKLLGENRSMVDQYEYERMYGTPNAFWDKPWRDWFRPSLYSAAHMLGYNGKPEWRQQADDTSAYFDKLEFTKWMALAEGAQTRTERIKYMREAQSTKYGVNPQGQAMSIYMALPESEKPFFDAFAFAIGKDRKRIMEMIPQDQTHLYQNIWSRLDRGERESFYPGSKTSVDDAYLAQRHAEAKSSFGDQPYPAADWIGWHKDVEVDDVKLKYINTLGRDIYEYDMYKKQEKKLTRKPYLSGSDEFLYQGPTPGRGDVYQALHRFNKGSGTGNPLEFSVHKTSMGNSTSSFYYDDNRESEIFNLVDRMMR